MGEKLVTQIERLVTLPKAKLIFKPDGESGYEDLRECRETKITKTVERLEIYSQRDSNVTKICNRVKSTKVAGTLVCITPVLQLLRFFCMADSVVDASQASGSLSKLVTAKLGLWLPLDKVMLSAVVVKDNAGKTFTADDDTDTMTCASHGLEDGDIVQVANTGGALPAPLVVSTNYYVVNAESGTFQLSLTAGGDPIDLTTDGTGTSKFYRVFAQDVDYELMADEGFIFPMVGGDIVADQVLSITGTCAAQTMQTLNGVTKVDTNGDLKILGTNEKGVKGKFEAYCSIHAEGDFSFIGDAEQQFSLSFECLKSANYPSLYKYTDMSGNSATRASV